jgi:predicted metal-binding membrane protein
MLENLLKRDRIIVLAGLVCITLLAWSYLLYLAQDMARMDMPMSVEPVGDSSMGDMPMGDAHVDDMTMDSTATEIGMPAVMPQIQPWQPREFLVMFVMWSVMMVAMMVPSAAPMILTFAAINRKRPSAQLVLSSTSAFVLGYLLVWVGFAFIATIAQGMLHRAALLSPMMATTNTLLAALLLVVAGIFQWTPLKYTCLHHCRSPIGFLLNEWHDGTSGALRMGVQHGIYCLGCCWSLMALLFVAGVMNIVWIAALAALVLLEKVAPMGHYLSRLAGIVFISWGTWLAVTALI